MIPGRHAKLHRQARSRHRQIKCVLKLDFLRLGHPKRTADVGKRFLREYDRARTHRPDLANKLNVFDCFREQLQTAAILFEKAESRAINLAVNEETDQTFVAQTRREGEFALRDVESGFGVAEKSVA